MNNLMLLHHCRKAYNCSCTYYRPSFFFRSPTSAAISSHTAACRLLRRQLVFIYSGVPHVWGYSLLLQSMRMKPGYRLYIVHIYTLMKLWPSKWLHPVSGAIRHQHVCMYVAGIIKSLCDWSTGRNTLRKIRLELTCQFKAYFTIVFFINTLACRRSTPCIPASTLWFALCTLSERHVPHYSIMQPSCRLHYEYDHTYIGCMQTAVRLRLCITLRRLSLNHLRGIHADRFPFTMTTEVRYLISQLDYGNTI
jgi:hypothetical protein